MSIDDELFEELAAQVAEPEEIPEVVNNHADQIKELIEACDDHAARIETLESEEPGSMLDRLSTLEEDFEQYVERNKDQAARISQHDAAIKQLRELISALKPTLHPVQEPSYPPLLELQARLRPLGEDWAKAECYDLGNGRVLIQNMTISTQKLEAHIASKTAKPQHPAEYAVC